MSEGGYKIRNQAAIHFITFAVVEWVDVFTRKDYRDIVPDSIRFCQQEKGMLLHSWCIMSNHIHLVLSAKNNDLSGLLRDFKKFTSKQLINILPMCDYPISAFKLSLIAMAIRVPEHAFLPLKWY